jgi:CheY-like chemotaxis protein
MLLLLGFVGSSAIAANRANRNLLATTRELMEKREIAETASRTKSEFLANMSHEIRTPLNGVMGIAGALAQTRLTDSQRDMVGLIETSARNLEILVSDILDLTRIESGRAEVAAEPFEPLAEVRVCAELFKATLAAKGLEFHLFPDEAARRPVLGDAARLRQIVCNLMSNAAKFTEEGSVTMRIGAQAVGERVRLTCEVEDTGIGFDAATKSRLFERFEQADGSITRRYGGSGLGLAISRSLAEAMGGSLTAESEPGEGSRFTLTLEVQAAPADAVVAPPVVAERPRAPAAPAQAEEAAPEVDAAPAMPEAGAPRVLLAEDHPINRRVVELILGAAGVDLTSVENGAEAVEAASRAHFDLILMDMQMPVMDGLAAIRAIRALDGPIAETPIFTLTANALPEHKQASAAAGADGHITKPVAPALLLSVVERAAETAAARAAAACERLSASA